MSDGLEPATLWAERPRGPPRTSTVTSHSHAPGDFALTVQSGGRGRRRFVSGEAASMRRGWDSDPSLTPMPAPSPYPLDEARLQARQTSPHTRSQGTFRHQPLSSHTKSPRPREGQMLAPGSPARRHPRRRVCVLPEGCTWLWAQGLSACHPRGTAKQKGPLGPQDSLSCLYLQQRGQGWGSGHSYSVHPSRQIGKLRHRSGGPGANQRGGQRPSPGLI